MMMLKDCPLWPKEFQELYRKEGCWRGETFGEMLEKRANSYGDCVALTCGARNVSYAELDKRVNELVSGFLAIGLKKNDRVVIQLPNIIEFFEVCFALFKIGALPVFALPTHRSSEINYFCQFAEATAYVIADKHAGFDYRSLARQAKQSAPSLKHVIVVGDSQEFVNLSTLYRKPIQKKLEVSPSDIAFLQLSGGSTGLSKLIPRTHDDYIYSLRTSNEVCGMNEKSVYLCALPVAHNFPLSSPGVLGTLYAGGRVVLSPGPSPDQAFPLIEKERVTITALVPPLALVWLEAKSSRHYDFSSLRVMQVGGAKLSAEVARRIKPTFDCLLQQVFGMAEGLVNYTRLDDDEETIIFTQGKPMSPYDEIRVVDDNDEDIGIGKVGHLLTRGPYTIRGYYKAEEHNAKAFSTDGFYRTGDLVSVDSKGYLTVEGRDKDQINRGGEKVAAEEVENHLLAHADIHDVAIVAMPDQYLGERSCAFVIRRPHSTIASNELKSFLKKRGLATFKIPDRIEFVEEFPYTPLGKVSKNKLRQQIADQLMKTVN